MKHMNKIAMAIGIIIICAAAYFGVRYYQTQHQDNVKIQNFCLGLCGEGKDGKGAGIGIGASDRGPLIVAGPWGSKKSERTKYTNDDDDVEVQGYYSSNE